MNRRLPILITLFFSLFIQTTLHSQQESGGPGIAEEELQGPRVNFINRSNRRATDTKRQREYDIGRILAKSVLNSNQGDEGNITVQRIFDRTKEGYGADIIRISTRSNYGHINGINRIIAGYLEKTFEYNTDDGMVVGRVILDYNARHRGDMKILAKYDPDVVSAINKKTLGIDKNYRKWPGNTEIIVPLKKNLVRPNGTDLDTGEVSKDTDVSKEDKSDLGRIKDERRSEDIGRLEEKQKDLQQEQSQLQNDQKQLEQEKENIDKQLENTKRKIQEMQKDPTKTAEVEQQKAIQEDLQQEKKDLENQIDENKQKQQENAQTQEEVKKQLEETKNEPAESAAGSGDADGSPVDSGTSSSQPAPAEVEKILEENKQLKEQLDEQEKMSPNVVSNKILFLRVLKYIQGGHYNNELWQIDPVKDDALRRGPYTQICGRDFTAIENAGVLIIGYEGSDHTDERHHLILLDPDTLAFRSASTENIFWRTPIIYRDNAIFVYEIFDNQYYLSRFGLDLKLQVRSQVAVNPDSDITFYNEKIYVTGKADSAGQTTIQVFNRDDLKSIKTIEP